jgi:predicted thioredoxin/glutaredoxin
MYILVATGAITSSHCEENKYYLIGVEGTATQLQSASQDVEKLWESNSDDYANAVNEMLRGVTDSKTPSDAEVLLKWVSAILAKDDNSATNPAAILAVQLRSIQVITDHFYSGKVDRNIKLRTADVVKEYLLKISKDMDKKYEPKSVVANVAPPPGVIGEAGMSPNAISDPKLKADYITAIRENAKNSAMNTRQKMLQKVDRRARQNLERFLQILVYQHPDTREFSANILAKIGFSKDDIKASLGE